MSELKKCFNEEPFNSSDPKLLQLIVKGRKLIRKYNALNPEEQESKREILKLLLGSMGNNVQIDLPFYCDYGCHIHIGDQVIIGMNCTFVDNHHITIGSYTMLASNVQIYTASHPLSSSDRIRSGWTTDKEGNFFVTTAHPVTIGEKVWIGGNVTILPGVAIGDRCMIGAGSVVTKDVPADYLAAGNPCKVIRKI